MPPRRKPAAPANRVYKSSTPLQQSRFPLRSTSVKYGKQTSKRISKQETLTQMAFVNLDRPLDEDDEELGIYEDEEDKPKKKRRKTTGDAPSSESKYHTQTLTQLGDWGNMKDVAEPGEDDAIYDIVSSSPQSKDLRKQRAEASKPQTPAIQRSSRRKTAPGNTGPPQTPHRSLAREIPSSESPATPPSRTSPAQRSALKEKSINIAIPFNTDPKPTSPSKLPRLRVGDTFESDDVSQQPPLPTTPSKKSSPAKSVRWAETDEVHRFGDSFPSTDGDEPMKSIVARSSTPMRGEIMDSEDEDFEESEDAPSAVDRDVLQPETCYGEIGVETQKLLETQTPPASPFVEDNQIIGEFMSDEILEDINHVDESQTLDGEMPGQLREDQHGVESPVLGEDLEEHMTEERTQYMESQRLATQQVRSMAPRTNNSDAFVSIRPENVSKIVDKTKNHEFRRQNIPDTVSRIWIYETHPTQLLKYMAVISRAKRPGEIEDEMGFGNAEFNAKDPNCGELAWEILELYELADPLPLATIVANDWLHGPPTHPTFVRPAVLDQLMANLKPAIFCRTPLVTELLTESSTDTQEAEEQLLNTIRQYTQGESGAETLSSQYIKQEDDEYSEDIADDEEYTYGENEDDEAEEENEERHARSHHKTLYPSNTVLNTSSQPNNRSEGAESPVLPPPKPHQTIPPPKVGTQRSHPTFSQAETVDLSQPQTQTPRHHHTTSDIIFESPTRPLFSSTPLTLPSLRQRKSSTAESIVPYSMNSSQLLTKSQMLPESLLNDSMPGNPLSMPLCIEDSEDEDEL